MMTMVPSRVKTLGKVVGTTGYHLSVGAFASPRRTRRFLGAVANAITDFDYADHNQLLDKLPNIELSVLCPHISELEFSITVTPSGDHGLPPSECLYLAALVHYLKPKTSFEIGTNLGRTTRLIAEVAAKDGKVYTLDLPSSNMLDGKCFNELNRALIGREFANHPCRDKIFQLFGNSHTFDFCPFYGQMDFVFIDGDHSYEGVRQDTENALRIIKPGGMIVWDDYYSAFPGIMRYLEELAAIRSICHLKGTRLACCKVESEPDFFNLSRSGVASNVV